MEEPYNCKIRRSLTIANPSETAIDSGGSKLVSQSFPECFADFTMIATQTKTIRLQKKRLNIYIQAIQAILMQYPKPASIMQVSTDRW